MLVSDLHYWSRKWWPVVLQRVEMYENVEENKESSLTKSSQTKWRKKCICFAKKQKLTWQFNHHSSNKSFNWPFSVRWQTRLLAFQDMKKQYNKNAFDILVCFSVLPFTVLLKISQHEYFTSVMCYITHTF